MHSAGDFDQRVTIGTPTWAKDAQGGAVRSDSAGTSLWAKVENVGASERFAEGSLQVRPEIRVVIRYRTGIKHRDTLTWRGAAYEIIAEPKEGDKRQQRRFLELMCVKRVAGLSQPATPEMQIGWDDDSAIGWD